MDRILTVRDVVEVMRGETQSHVKRVSVVESYPQVRQNVRVKDKKASQEDGDVQAEVSKVPAALGNDGRILLRQSGTEPVVRVMVEAPDHDNCERYVDQVIEVMKKKGHML